MTTDELLDDLNERIHRGCSTLGEIWAKAAEQGDADEMARTTAKMDGLLVVQDWLRSYR